MPIPPIRVLINGAGVAGPALAAMLLSSTRPYAITVVERAATLRTGGQQVDLRSHGLPVARKMGLLAAIKARCVKERGIALVDDGGAGGTGRVRAVLGVNDTGRGEQALTSEYEILRGDLVDIMYQASLAAAEGAAARRGGMKVPEILTYEFGKHATEVSQQQQQPREGVNVTFSDGSRATFDLVVAADGQSSHTRRLAFGEKTGGSEDNEAPMFRSLGVYSAQFSVPRDDAEEMGDPHLAKIYHVPGLRTVATRTGDAPTTQVSLSTMRPTPGLVAAMAEHGTSTAASGRGVEEQKRAWEALFRGTGWRADRLLEGLRTTGDFYAFEAGQVKMERWSRGRVVVLGDAGYCPSPMTGMGTTCALIGSYILAGELARHGEDIDAALREYEKAGRPFVDEAQRLPEVFLKLWYRDTRLQIQMMHMVLGAFTRLKLDKMLYKLLPEKKAGLQFPAYPELEYLTG